ncbi:hypothetical protein NUW58_g186 [Xylaria curta]|uniref:Uncharacterized protein n=1 Tax=Xylaria curta TaxID=42375 RepID=A0ACC1PQN5_9PEZI|nr:hypothetical protein NUW58_g186 [Xylaria curta]
MRRSSQLESGVKPFLIGIEPHQMNSNIKALAADSYNISVYLIGDAPNPANRAQNLGFIAQHANDGSTTYFMPPNDTPQGATITAHAPNLSWKVGPGGSSFKTPGTVKSGRIYLVDGYLDFYSTKDGKIIHPDPHNPSDIASRELWGFVEFSHAKDPSNGNEDMTVNLSFVDWVSFPLGMNVTFQDGDGQKTVSIPGLKPDGLVKICEALSTLDNFWPKLCLKTSNNTPLRVMSPEKYISLHPDDHDASNYYEPYISRVWEKYKKVDLHINTQVDGPKSDKKVNDGLIVTCRVHQSDNVLHCDNDAGDFSRPVSRDIYGCNTGPFANPSNAGTESWSRARLRPRLCAAFARSTIHLDGTQPSHSISSDKYYQENITNHYARLVHENLINGMGYAFSYDDVSPNSNENSAGLVSMAHPLNLVVFINS